MKLKTAIITAFAAACCLSTAASAGEHHSFSLESGTYGGAQFVWIYTDDDTEVYYTTDGSAPDSSSAPVGSAPVVVTENTTIRTAAYTDGELTETDSVTIKIRTASPRANKDSGTYNDKVKVKLSCAEDGARIYYTTDGSTPTKESKRYRKAITITEDTTLKFIAYSDDHAKSKVVTRRYKITDSVYENEQRQQMFELVNSTRAEKGLAPLEELPELSDIAQQRAKECSAYFSHWRPNGTKWYTLLEQAGLMRSVRGENIAYFYPTAKQALAAWMDDSGHRANVLAPDGRYIGIGYYNNGYTSYWVQLVLGDG